MRLRGFDKAAGIVSSASTRWSTRIDATGRGLMNCWSSFSWRRMTVHSAIVLDLDNTDIPLHGSQEGRSLPWLL